MNSLDNRLDNYYPRLIFFKESVTHRDTLAEYKSKHILTKRDWEYICSYNGNNGRFSTYEDYRIWADEYAEEKYAEYLTIDVNIQKIAVSSPEDEEEQIQMAREKGWNYVYV